MAPHPRPHLRQRTHLGSIWRAADGSVFLPFDPDEVIENYWSERYLRGLPRLRVARAARSTMMRAYYRTRPLLPRCSRSGCADASPAIQARSPFPRWPVETCLHDFFELMFAILAGLAGGPIPYIAPWPTSHDWALVLTHDVEQARRSTRRWSRCSTSSGPTDCARPGTSFPVDTRSTSSCVLISTEQGFEVGVHGLYPRRSRP